MGRMSEYKLANSEGSVEDASPGRCTWMRMPWTITIFAALLQFVHVGFLYNFGLFFDELQLAFGSSVALTGWVGSISYCFFMFGTFLTTWTLRRLSCRKVAIMGVILGSVSLLVSSFSPTILYVVVSYGIFFGLSSNVTMITTFELVVPLFQDSKRRASAMIVIAFGATIGNFSMSNPIKYIMVLVGWRWTFRIFAAILFVVGLGCCTFFSRPTTNVSKRDVEEVADKKASSDGRLLFFPEVWLFSLATLTCFLALVFQYVYMASFLESIGLNDQMSATGNTILAIGDGLSKVIIVFAAPRISFPLIYCLPVSLLLLSIVSLVLTWTKNIYAIFAVTLCYGLPRGMCNGLQIPTGLEVFGASRSKTSANILLFWSGVGNLAGPFIHGSLYDLTGSYFPALYLCAALYLVSSFTMLMTPLWQKYYAPERYMVDYKRSEDKKVQNQSTECIYLEQRISVV